MDKVVAKRYVKAILNETDKANLQEMISNITSVCSAFGNEKFQNIIDTPTLSIQQKADFVISLLDNPGQKFKNFIHLLSLNKRLKILPLILDEIQAQIFAKDNIYAGKIYTNIKLDDSELLSLQQKLSSHLKADIKLDNLQGNSDGIKVSLDDLNLQMSFSMDRLKTQMSEYILKAI